MPVGARYWGHGRKAWGFRFSGKVALVLPVVLNRHLVTHESQDPPMGPGLPCVAKVGYRRHTGGDKDKRGLI